MPKPRHKRKPVQPEKPEEGTRKKSWKPSNSRRQRGDVNQNSSVSGSPVERKKSVSKKSSPIQSKPPSPKSAPAKVEPAPTGEPIRLHRFLAQCGIASRRKAEEIIAEGRVTVNGLVVTEQGVKVGPEDEVEVDGTRISPPTAQLYLLNKPVGIVTTMDDEKGRTAIADLLPPSASSVKPVGRLDMNTSGLIFLTNDGDLAHRITHPRYQIEKEYIAVVQGIPTDKILQRLSRGITLDGEKTAPSQWEFISQVKNENQSRIRIVLHEGRNRQIRKMAEALGHPVISLRRVRIGNFIIKGMEEGEMRLIGKKDYEALRKKLGLIS